jgi:hypothetical protein
MVLLFSDTYVEEPSLYVFLEASANQLGVPLVRVADSRTPFQVYWDVQFLGNSRLAPCSRLLKQVPARKWLNANADPVTTILYVGIDAGEARRIPGIRAGWSPWTVHFPLTAEPQLTKEAMLAEARALGLSPPDAYAEGFAHANCAGMCVRAGQRHWRRLLEIHPQRFREAEIQEQRFRDRYGDVAILKETRGGTTYPLPLAELRRRVEAQAA